LSLAGLSTEGYGFDGSPIPLTKSDILEAERCSQEHVNVEFWGYSINEGAYGATGWSSNNTYKALRVVSEDYNFYYAVWCNGDHELYNMQVWKTLPRLV
jgi:hypothetical protein